MRSTWPSTPTVTCSPRTTGPDRDMSDELNWLRAGHHYGFPWRMGGADNPQQFPDYDPALDLLLDERFPTVQSGAYHNDPTFPPPGDLTLTEPLVNVGPDADSFRDPQDGQVRDASASGLTLSTFTARRAPLGLVFDRAGVLRAGYRGGGFVLGWTPGDPAGDSVPGPFKDASQDLLHLRRPPGGPERHGLSARRIVGGFDRPVDAELVDHQIFVLEWGGHQSIWEVTLPGVRP